MIRGLVRVMVVVMVMVVIVVVIMVRIMVVVVIVVRIVIVADADAVGIVIVPVTAVRTVTHAVVDVAVVVGGGVGAVIRNLLDLVLQLGHLGGGRGGHLGVVSVVVVVVAPAGGVVPHAPHRDCVSLSCPCSFRLRGGLVAAAGVCRSFVSDWRVATSVSMSMCQSQLTIVVCLCQMSGRRLLCEEKMMNNK